MKIASGPRPLSIKLFAAICLLSAVIALVRGLLHPLETQGMLWGYTGAMWNRDTAIVILFSLFTIALIPIVWIYFVASPIARWIVVFFGIVRLWPFLADPSYILAAAAYVPMELVAPILQIIAIALLFTPSSRLWFANENTDAETI